MTATVIVTVQLSQHNSMPIFHVTEHNFTGSGAFLGTSADGARDEKNDTIESVSANSF